MGVFFTFMFAAGVVMLERGVGTRVDLDAQHALYGAVELTYWRGPTDWASFLDPAVWAALPHSIGVLAGVAAPTAALVVLFYKELTITTFDPALPTSLGIHPAPRPARPPP